MPSLPRIRRTRPRGFAEAVVPRPEPRVAELTANGLTWIHLESLDPETVNALRARFGWHPLDVEDVLSKRQRPKIDDYADEGYLFGVLHFPVYDKAVQRLNAAELDFFLGQGYLAPPEPCPAFAHDRQRDLAAADPYHGALRDECQVPRLRHRARVLDHLR